MGYTTIANNIQFKDNRVVQVGKNDGDSLPGPYHLGSTSEHCL